MCFCFMPRGSKRFHFFIHITRWICSCLALPVCGRTHSVLTFARWGYWFSLFFLHVFGIRSLSYPKFSRMTILVCDGQNRQSWIMLIFYGSSQWRSGVVTAAEASIWAFARWGFPCSFFGIRSPSYSKFSWITILICDGQNWQSWITFMFLL